MKLCKLTKNWLEEFTKFFTTKRCAKCGKPTEKFVKLINGGNVPLCEQCHKKIYSYEPK